MNSNPLHDDFREPVPGQKSQLIYLLLCFLQLCPLTGGIVLGMVILGLAGLGAAAEVQFAKDQYAAGGFGFYMELLFWAAFLLAVGAFAGFVFQRALGRLRQLSQVSWAFGVLTVAASLAGVFVVGGAFGLVALSLPGGAISEAWVRHRQNESGTPQQRRR